MMISKARKRELKSQIRSLLLKNPRIGSYEVSKQIEGVEQKFALRLMDEIRDENAIRIDKKKVKEELGRMEEEIYELKEKMTLIINKPDGKDRDKVSAFRALVEAEKTLFLLQREAGIFDKGSSTLDKKLKLSLILQHARPELRQKFLDAWRELTTEREQSGDGVDEQTGTTS